MEKLLLLLLSVFMFGGCSGSGITIISPSKVFLPPYEDKNVTVTVTKRGDKFVIPISDFNMRTRLIVDLKEHISAVNKIIEVHNNYDYTGQKEQQ